MFIYFDRNGYIREQISAPVRQGSSTDAVIYAYFEPSENLKDIDGTYLLPPQYTSASINFLLADSVIATTTDKNYGEKLEIPYDKKRDLKYFKYFHTYEFIEITIPNAVLSVSGNVSCTITCLGASAAKTLDTFTFLVQESVVMPFVDITEPMYHNLLATVTNKKIYRHTIECTLINGNTITLQHTNMSLTPIVTVNALKDITPIYNGVAHDGSSYFTLLLIVWVFGRNFIVRVYTQDGVIESHETVTAVLDEVLEV